MQAEAGVLDGTGEPDDDATMSYCPVASKGVRATVTSTGDGFAVDVRGDDPKTVDEILRRTRALTAPR